MKSNKRAFSIVELMIALAVTTIILGGLMAFNIQLIKGGLYSERKNQTNKDIRKITTDWGDVAKEANYFVIYSSFKEAARDDEEDRLVSNQSGDFILFVHTSSSYVSFGVQPVERIVGYYRTPGTVEELTNVGPVLKFDISYSTPVDITASESLTLESLIPGTASVVTEEILELSKGTANGKLFYNFGNKSVVIAGKIYQGDNRKRLTDTYNFTVSPRG